MRLYYYIPSLCPKVTACAFIYKCIKCGSHDSDMSVCASREQWCKNRAPGYIAGPANGLVCMLTFTGKAAMVQGNVPQKNSDGPRLILSHFY